MKSRLVRKCDGFVLLTVVVLLAILAAVVMMLSSTTNTEVGIVGQLDDSAALGYAAESGLEHTIWLLNQNNGCSGYSDLAVVPLGESSYRATVSPHNGSPVSILSKGFLANGAEREIFRQNVTVYDQSDVRTLTLGSAANVKDVFLEGQDGHTTHNKATDDNITVSAEPGKVKRGLVEFDLSELPGSVRVESAVLELELNKFGFSDEIEVFRVTQTWTEAGVTWESRNGSSDWDTQGGDYDDVMVGSLSVSGTGIEVLDLTDLVASWSAGVFENNGIMLLSPESSGATSNEFTSSDSGSGALPKLTISYSCECGTNCTGEMVSFEPVAHWRFDDSVGTTAIDSEGGHHGMLENGPKWTALGQVDGALEFDGLNDKVSVAHNEKLSLTEALTISAWIKSVDEPSGSGNRIISKETPGQNDNFWFSKQSGALWFGVGGEFFTDSQLLNDNQWYHVAATFDSIAGEVRFYVDGIETVVASTNTTIIANAEPVVIGSNWEQTKPWHGDLDDVRLYNRALSQEEIVDVMSTGSVGGGSPVFESYRDRFDARDYDGDDGSLSWATDWLEIGENDGPNNGDERARSDDDNDNEYAIRVRDNDSGGEGVQREFDLSGCANATFSYDYRREGFDNVNDYVTVSASDNGGSSWTELTRYPGPANDDYYLHSSIDLSVYAATNSRIRFLTSPSFGGADILWVDNVDITCE